MNPEATFFCYLIALVLFVLAAANVPERFVNYVAAGLAFALLPTFWAAMRAL